MTNKISELWVKDLPEHIKENLNDLVRSINDDLVRSINDMDRLTQVFWIQYGLQNVNNYGVISLRPSYAVRYEEISKYYKYGRHTRDVADKSAKSSGTRYIYQGDDCWNKLDSLYKELMREEKLNKLGIL
jgi:hypothetical protein